MAERRAADTASTTTLDGFYVMVTGQIQGADVRHSLPYAKPGATVRDPQRTLLTFFRVTMNVEQVSWPGQSLLQILVFARTGLEIFKGY